MGTLRSPTTCPTSLVPSSSTRSASAPLCSRPASPLSEESLVLLILHVILVVSLSSFTLRRATGTWLVTTPQCSLSATRQSFPTSSTPRNATRRLTFVTPTCSGTSTFPWSPSRSTRSRSFFRSWYSRRFPPHAWLLQPCPHPRHVSEDGSYRYVKWHFRTNQGIKNFTAEEANHLAGANPDYATSDLFNAIERGDCPSWNVYIQIIEPDQALSLPL